MFQNLSIWVQQKQRSEKLLSQSVTVSGMHFSWMGTSNYEELLPPSCAHKIEAACIFTTLVSISTTPCSNRILIFVLQINKDGSFLIKDIQHSDEGNYSCSIENVHGSDEIVYSVRVLGMSY